MSTRFLALAAGLALTLAACGDGAEPLATPAGAETQSADAVEAAPQPAPADEPAAADQSDVFTVDVLAGESELGPILVGADGRTLYGFTNDVDAISACYGTCADAWPPVIVSDDWTAGPGLDFGIFATTVREDGQRQLVAGRWPLYFFAGDAAPGDIKGQGSGDVWFAVDLDGRLIEGAGGENAVAPADDGAETEATAETAAAVVATGSTELGEVLIDGDGLTLYGFLNDRDAGGPSCNDACADAWPPVVVDGTELPAGLDPEVFSLMPRDDGSMQLAAGIWPLYLFAGDAAPGDVNGQGSGDVWFAVAPDGKLVGAPEAAMAETADTSETSDSDDSGEGQSNSGYGSYSG